MKKLSTLAFLCFVFVVSGFGQSLPSESHNFITYDTLIPYVGQPANKWSLRISRPANLFTPGSPDTASRPAIISMPGIGEVGTDPSYLTRYGPHYWMNNGWDGSVALGNGVHYPIIITICEATNNSSPYYLSNLMDSLKKWYHIKTKGVHVAGLSMGAFEWGDLICWSAYSGDEHAMSGITSYVALSGEGSTFDANNTGYNYPGFQAYTVWAQKYGGKLWGMQGSMDERYVWNVRDAMEAGAPGSAYFAYTQDGGGQHCCWNDEYNPNAHDWQCVAPITNSNIVNNLHPNSMGTYREGSSVVQWMLRQGDTTLVGSGSTPPPPKPVPAANAGTGQTITLPTSSVNLSGSGSESGGSIVGYQWTMVAGPTPTVINNSNTTTPSATGLVVPGVYTYQLTVTDNSGTTASSLVSITVNAAPATPPPTGGSSAYVTLPGTVSASNYASSLGIQTENTLDAGGGLDVGWIDQGDWMNYNVMVTQAGAFQVSFRVTTPNNGAAFQLQDNAGNVLTTMQVTNTGGWQSWTTISTVVQLPAGKQTLHLVSAASPGWNINWIQFSLPISAGPGVKQIPGTIQAENFDNMSGIATESTADAGGGLDVGWIDQGDWIDYLVNVSSAGSYTLNFRVASPDGGSFAIQNGQGQTYTTVNFSNTGGYQSWANVSTTINLPAGQQVLRLTSTAAAEWNVNWIQATGNSTASSGSKQIPGTIQAENYDNMSGISTEATTDAGGGSDVGWIDNGDWMDYSVNVATAGSYTVNFRVATPNSGGSFAVQNGQGQTYTTVSFGNSGGWQSWTTVSATINLPAGAQTLRLTSTSTGWNINWMQFSAATNILAAAAPAAPAGIKQIPGLIQAENFDDAIGGNLESTSDVGGGQDIGWIYQGNFLDYTVYAANAGSYTFSFRIASPVSGSGITLGDGQGTVYATLSFPNTGGWQNWATVTATATLPAGVQTLRVTSASANMFNFNWFQASLNTAGAVATPGVAGASASSLNFDPGALTGGSGVRFFPNPVKDLLTLETGSRKAGKIKVQLLTTSGVVMKNYEFNTATPGTQLQVPMGDVPVGVYLLRIEGPGWQEIKKVEKI